MRETDAVAAFGICADDVAQGVGVVVVQNDTVVAEHFFQVGGCVGVVHARLGIEVGADAVFHEVARQAQRLAHEVAGNASADGHLTTLVADVHLSHCRHLGSLGECFQIGCGRHVANALYDDVLAFEHGAVVHDGRIILVFITTEDEEHFAVRIGREDVFVESAVMGEIHVRAVVLFECFVKVVGHLRAVDAALARKLLDDGHSLEVVFRHVECRHTFAGLLRYGFVDIRGPAGPGGSGALCGASPQLGRHDSAAVGLHGLWQVDVLVGGFGGSFALHGDVDVVDGVGREVMDVESAREVLVGRYGLRVGGVLHEYGVVESLAGIVVQQGQHEQRAAVGIFLPRLLGLVHVARLPHRGLGVGNERVGGADGFVGLQAEVEVLVADDIGLVEEHVVPAFREVGIGLAYQVVG